MPKRVLYVFMILILPFLFSGCQKQPSNNITQVSTIDALLAGVYDGHMTLKQLRKHGDFGIGTFDALDGEMMLLDGKFYKIKSDGKIYKPSFSEKTPFACVTYFIADYKETIAENMDFEALKERIDSIFPSQNRFCAFLIKGTFSHIKIRSVPIQEKPYPQLSGIIKNQPIFNLLDTRGTMIGFRLPAFVKGVNAPGYHAHFITEDFIGGGHVLEFEIIQGTLELDTVHESLNIYLPAENAFFDATDFTKDRTKDLHIAEQGTR